MLEPVRRVSVAIYCIEFAMRPCFPGGSLATLPLLDYGRVARENDALPPLRAEPLSQRAKAAKLEEATHGHRLPPGGPRDSRQQR
jgi:hypothetical protein